ncbi:MAG TPA: TVP38/TMEM64 family protein [Candidatus Saccharimonadia bacterium]|nr:TVP38/TMEM64 family protein [Candidatus Saccharimonadia bacterium]
MTAQLKTQWWKRRRLGRWKWVAGIVLLLAVVLMVARDVPVVDWLEGIAKPLRELGWMGVVAYAGIFFVAGLLCLPCLPVTLTSGYIFGMVGGVIAVHTGATLGAACGFLLGRLAGRAHVAEFLKKSKRFHFLEGAIAHEGWKIVALLRMHAVPFGLSNYLYGMTSLKFWPFLLATTLAMLPGHIIYVYLGMVGGRYLRKADMAQMGPAEWSAAGLSIGSALLLAVVITRMVRKYGRNRVSEAE